MPSEVEKIRLILLSAVSDALDADSKLSLQAMLDVIPEAAAAIAALRSQDRGAREPSAFRVGRQVPRNVYRGDAPMFMAATEAEAAEMVVLLNAGRLALAEQEKGR